MLKQHERNVQNQFGPRANAYVASAVHSQGEDLKRLATLAEKAQPKNAIDLGCGGGHVSYAMAPHAARVTASDLSADMLAAVSETARAKGLSNIETTEASAEKLPFADASFDFLGCRYSAHHWFNVEKGLAEARRVLSTGAPAIFIDVYTPGRPLFDTHLQSVELLRDTSHVRNYSISEWMAMLSKAGFSVEESRTWRMRMEFESWTERMATPQNFRDAIRALQISAPREVKDFFGIEEDGSFMLDMMMVEAKAA